MTVQEFKEKQLEYAVISDTKMLYREAFTRD